jgi:hypothetical protein
VLLLFLLFADVLSAFGVSSVPVFYGVPVVVDVPVSMLYYSFTIVAGFLFCS